MISPDARAAGLAATRASKTQERRYFNWLRDTGLYPDARRAGGGSDGHGGIGDGAGVGPRIIEVTFRPWERTPEKLRQAEADAGAAGLAEYWVWRPVKRGDHEPGTVARSVLVGRADMVWTLLAELDWLRREAGR